jgi:hypothetical protein
MYSNYRISIVIPCFNEAEGLGQLLEKVPACVDEVVVDNNSTDGTAGVAKKGGAKVIFERTKGYGRAYHAGLAAASGDIIVMLDGDNSYPIELIGDFAEYLANGSADFVTGDRFSMMTNGVMPKINQMANRITSAFLRKFYSIDLKDSQSGMMGVRMEVLSQILSKNPGMPFSWEIKLNAWLHPSIKCVEMPIPYRHRVGQVKYKRYKDSFDNVICMIRYMAALKAPIEPLKNLTEGGIR